MAKPIAASAFILVFAFFCNPLRSDIQPAPKKIIAFFMGYEGSEDKPYARVFVSTFKDSDPRIEKWIKDRHFKLEYSVRVVISDLEMEKIIASVKKLDAKAGRLFDTYRLFLLDADGDTMDFQIPQPSVNPLFLAIAKCDIPKPTSEELQGAANRFR